MKRKRFTIIIGLSVLLFVLACACPAGEVFNAASTVAAEVTKVLPTIKAGVTEVMPTVEAQMTANAGGVNTDFAGTWSETWCVGESSDVTYSDVYDLTISGSTLNIVAPERPNYDFSEISVEDQNLKFVLTNTNGSGVTIDYDLKISSDGMTMEGTADTNEGVHCSILWEKQ